MRAVKIKVFQLTAHQFYDILSSSLCVFAQCDQYHCSKSNSTVPAGALTLIAKNVKTMFDLALAIIERNLIFISLPSFYSVMRE